MKECEVVLETVCEARMTSIDSRLALVITIQIATFAAIIALIFK